MLKKSIAAWEDYCYDPEELQRDKRYSSRIVAKGIKHTGDTDRLNNLISLAFDLHVTQTPSKVDINNIEYTGHEASDIFNRVDIARLFVNSYYDYPDLLKVHRDDIGRLERTIPQSEVLESIRKSIASRNAVVVMVGDVGEGKSAFLSKLTLDLREHKGDLKYIPVIVDVRKYNDILEKDDAQGISGRFWLKVCEDIIEYLKRERLQFITGERKREKIIQAEKGMRLRAGAGAHFPFTPIIADMVAFISRKRKDVETLTDIRTIDICSQIVEKASELKTEHNTRLVLIFDNLDTFSYEHERFHLFQSGLERLQSKIDIVWHIFQDCTTTLFDSEISFIFTARPYVYSQVFQPPLQYRSEGRVDHVFRLGGIDPNTAIDKRLQMLEDLLVKFRNLKETKPGTEEKVREIAQPFIEAVRDLIKTKRRESISKFGALANQGLRSLVWFYHQLEYDLTLLQRCFRSHDILYLYLLGRMELYSQLLPPLARPPNVSYFPNVFLVRTKNYYNKKCPDAYKPNRLTFWLKYMILAIVLKKTEKHPISVQYVLDRLPDYDEHAVRLCLGNLATTNEFNCLNLRFPSNVTKKRVGEIEELTEVTITPRGRFLIQDDYCLGLECLQLYFDDWLIPRPKPEYFKSGDFDLSDILKPRLDEKYSYSYLQDTDGLQYEERRAYIIGIKTRQALFLLALLAAAKKYEAQVYKQSWHNFKQIVLEGTQNNIELGDNWLPTKATYGKLQGKIIDDAWAAMSKREDLQFKTEIDAFSQKLNANQGLFDNYFELIRGVTPIKGVDNECFDKP